MIDKLKHKYTIENAESISAIRKAQRENKFIIPSDYVYFMMTFNGLKFEDTPYFFYETDEFEFNEFYNLELLVWELNHFRNMVENYQTKFWLEDYISVGSLDDKRLLLGKRDSNINRVYIYDNEENRMEFISNNIFDFINDSLIYN